MKVWRRYLAWRQRHVTRLEPTANGFLVVEYSKSSAIDWDAITRIVACKRDLYTTDLLCLLIQTRETLIEIHEEMPGFVEIEPVLEARLGIAPDWKLKALFPAFAANPADIFVRS